MMGNINIAVHVRTLQLRLKLCTGYRHTVNSETELFKTWSASGPDVNEF